MTVISQLHHLEITIIFLFSFLVSDIKEMFLVFTQQVGG